MHQQLKLSRECYESRICKAYTRDVRCRGHQLKRGLVLKTICVIKFNSVPGETNKCTQFVKLGQCLRTWTGLHHVYI